MTNFFSAKHSVAPTGIRFDPRFGGAASTFPGYHFAGAAWVDFATVWSCTLAFLGVGFPAPDSSLSLSFFAGILLSVALDLGELGLGGLGFGGLGLGRFDGPGLVGPSWSRLVFCTFDCVSFGCEEEVCLFLEDVS